MKFLFIVGYLLLVTGATASDLAKVFERQLEAVFANSPVAVEGWIKRTDGKRGRIEFRWSTKDKTLVQKLHDFVANMKPTDYENSVEGGISAGVYLRISSAAGVGKDENFVYVTYSGAYTRDVSASLEPEKNHFDELVRLVYAMNPQGIREAGHR